MHMFITVLALALAGCSASQQRRVEQAGANVLYDRELVRCQEVGKQAGSFAVFESCERAASRSLCVSRPELQTTWPRCAEVGVTP